MKRAAAVEARAAILIQAEEAQAEGATEAAAAAATTVSPVRGRRPRTRAGTAGRIGTGTTSAPKNEFNGALRLPRCCDNLKDEEQNF